VPALALARDRKLPILVLVFNNRGYRSMAANHRSFYPEGVAKQHDDFRGEAINGVNWDELAAPFDALGLRVRTAAELRPALEAARAAMSEGRSVILNAEIAIEAPRARPDVST
jgi:thiamine pyrophosphate-dependent acetolactate synthase large subunit-like protein